MELLSIIVDDETYAVEVKLVQKVARRMSWTGVPTAPRAVVGIANLKGGIVTLLSLSELLKRGRSGSAEYAVVLKPFSDGYGQIGLLIDRPGGLITIDDERILPQHFTSEEQDENVISGLADLDGHLYRIIDIQAILRRY